MKCGNCPCPDSLACFAETNGLTDWCNDLAKWRWIILGRSLGSIVDEQVPDEMTGRLDRARHCPDADGPWRGCACHDRQCSRMAKIVSVADCLECVSQ